MVSTRYYLAKTRSQKQKKTYSKTLPIFQKKVKSSKNKCGGNVGTFKLKKKTSDPTSLKGIKFCHEFNQKKHVKQSKPKVGQKKSKKVSMDTSPSKHHVGKKMRTVKHSNVTKLVMPCRLANKVNCSVQKEKKKQRSSVSKKESNEKKHILTRKNDEKPKKIDSKKQKNVTTGNFKRRKSSKASPKNMNVISTLKTEKTNTAKISKLKTTQINNSKKVTNTAVPQKLIGAKQLVGVKQPDVTKLGKLCKISKKVNQSVHKKKQNDSVAIKAEYVKNPSSSDMLEVKSKKTSNKKKKHNIESEIKNIKRSSLKMSDFKTQRTENNKTPNIDHIHSKSKVNLSPVTFKKNIRKFLINEILRRKQENSLERPDSKEFPVASFKSAERVNVSCSSSSCTTSRLPKTQQSSQLISAQNTNRKNNTINPSVNNNVPNLVLSTNRSSPISTKKEDHSTFQKNEHNTRFRSYCNRVVTRNIIQKTKILKSNFKYITKQNMSGVIKKMRTPHLQQIKLKNQIVSVQNNSAKRLASMPSLNQPNQKAKPFTTKSENVTPVMQEKKKKTSIHPKKNEGQLIQSKELKKLDDKVLNVVDNSKKIDKSFNSKAKDFISKSENVTPVMQEKKKKKTFIYSKKYKGQQIQSKEQNELDDEILNIVDDLKEVDKNVNSKILSLKLKDNILEFPQQAQMTNTLIIKKNKSPIHLDSKNVQNPKNRSGKKKQRVEKFIKNSEVFGTIVRSKESVTSSPKATNVSSQKCIGNEPSDEALSKSNRTLSTSSSICNSRTTLPLTLKTKIVVTNGKKVKKKLSLKEQRIYNLLRCYGDKSFVEEFPEKAPKNTGISGDKQVFLDKYCHDKKTPKTNKIKEKAEEMLKQAPMKTQENANTSEDKGDSLVKPCNSEGPPKTKRIKEGSEKDMFYPVKKRVTSDSLRKNQQKNVKLEQSSAEKIKQKNHLNLNKGSITPTESSLTMEKVALVSHKEKRRLHKVKYNIIKNCNDSEQKHQLLSEDPKNSINDTTCYKQNGVGKRIEYIQSICNSSGIGSADDVDDCRGNEISMEESNEKEIEDPKNQSMPGRNFDIDGNESDGSMGSIFEKYKTKPKIKRSTLISNGNNKSNSEKHHNKTKGHKEGTSRDLSEKFPNKLSQPLKHLSVENNQSITTNLIHNNKSNHLDRSSKNIDGYVHSDVDIFDDSKSMCTLTNKPINKDNNDNITRPLPSDNNKTLVINQQEKEQLNSDSYKFKERNEKFKEINDEHKKKYKTKDLVENLMQWTSQDKHSNSLDHSLVKNRERDVLNYRDYTTRTGFAQNPVRILKRKACEDLKKELNNEYKNRKNGKDYFQCICFNKFFITRVRNKNTHNFDILTVKVKPSKSENVFSINDVQFCTFCSRLYNKYKNNFILINQEYIMKEFIEQHTKSWKRINKSYDNEFSMNTSSMSNFCNLSFASTTTSTPCESHTNSRTESRLDSISSDKTESINMGSEYSDLYLNEIFFQNMKKARDPTKLASSHESQHYKQKCRNVNMKINEICDLYTASSKRISSTETKSNVTDDCSLDDGVFARPNNFVSPFENGMKGPNIFLTEKSGFDDSKNSTPCKSPVSIKYAQQAYDACCSKRCHTPCNSHRYSTPSDNIDDDSDEQLRATKQLRTPCSFKHSQTPSAVYSPRKDYMQKHKFEKTNESFERIFHKVWQKCSPSAKRHLNTRDNWFSNSPRKTKKAKLSDDNNQMYKRHTKQASMNHKSHQSSFLSDFTDEYDADLSDSDGNCDSNNLRDCYSCSIPKRSSQFSKHKERRNRDLFNRSLGNDVIYKERHQYVNKFFIKQSSKHLFTNNKTSYSDSEQVIKIRNVKKKIYTTVHHKVFNAQDDLMDCRSGLKRSNICTRSDRQKDQANYSSCSQNMKNDHYNIEKRKCFDKHDGNTSAYKVQREMNRTSVDTSADTLSNQQSETTALKDKIQQIEYENLWKKLVDEETDCSNNIEFHQDPKELNHSDSIIETDTDRDEQTLKLRSEDSGIQSITTDSRSPMDMATEIPSPAKMNSICSPDTTNNTTNQRTENVANKKYTNNILDEILVSRVDHSIRKSNNYERIKEDIKNYSYAVSQSSESFNKQHVLKLIKTLMKSKSITFKDYTNALKVLKINVNLNNNNDFLIKQVINYSEQDDIIMKHCYSKLYEKYHQNNLEHSTSTILNETMMDIHEMNKRLSTDTRDQLETFESFKARLINPYPDKQEEIIKKRQQDFEKISGYNVSNLKNNFEFHIDMSCDDEFDISIPLNENGLILKNNSCPKASSTPAKFKPTEADEKVETNLEPSQSSENWRDKFVIKEEVAPCVDQFIVQTKKELVSPKSSEENS